jgi:hypothetical protein
MQLVIGIVIGLVIAAGVVVRWLSGWRFFG